jgi:hypothetical protein
MKHTTTDKERMVLQVLMDTMLHAECNQQQVYTISVLLMANVILGILRDRVVPGGDAEIINDTVKGIRSAMEMFRRVKAAEDKVSA